MTLNALLVCTLLAAGGPPPDAAHAEWSGTFNFSNSEAELAGRKEAIARSTEGVFFLIRGVVGSRVEDKTRILPALTFHFPPGKVSFSTPVRPPIETPDDLVPFKLKIDGEELSVSQGFKDNALVQIFAASDGVRTNRFYLEEGGKVLRMKVEIHSQKLPNPVVYQLTYRRS